ncbi:MAG: acetyltransferase [Pseudomonadota bacterium]|jgi:GNAT superfamily N-acetyltransferase
MVNAAYAMSYPQPMTARIERLGPGDGERWRTIRLEALREAPYAFGTTYADAVHWDAARWEQQVTKLATFVSVVDGHDVGVARGAAQGNSNERELISMWVAPSARRQNVGTLLIDSVVTWARTEGAGVLVLEVVTTNAPAIALYERAGFVRVPGEATAEGGARELRLVRSLAT